MNQVVLQIVARRQNQEYYGNLQILHRRHQVVLSFVRFESLQVTPTDFQILVVSRVNSNHVRVIPHLDFSQFLAIRQLARQDLLRYYSSSNEVVPRHAQSHLFQYEVEFFLPLHPPERFDLQFLHDFRRAFQVALRFPNVR